MSDMQKAYIAGPMTGIPHFNIPAFDAAAGALRDSGYWDVTSPAELDDPEDREAAYASPDGGIVHYTKGKTWGDFLARDIKLISDGGFDAIVVLPGWERSKGARLETFVGAGLMGLPVWRYVEHDPDFSNAFTLHKVSDIELYRAWCAEPLLAIHAMYGSVIG